MQNFMKTIISAIQSWTNDTIKDSTADWNQNDSSASNYVKNRTHWEDSTDVVLLQETMLEFTAIGRDGGKWGVVDFELEDGQIYTVVWDGITYECAVQKVEGVGNYSIGDDSIIEGGGGNGEPFWIGSYSGMTIMASTVGIHTVSISIHQSVVHKLDKKYLTIETPDWNQNDPNADNYIKNRPFYESTEDVIVVPEQTITVENNSADFEYNTVENMWNNGTEYTVIFDGVSYTGTSYEDSDACIHTDFVTNDGYKVEVYDYNFLHVSGMIGEHTIQIILNNMPAVHKMDEKFIPDTVATKDELTIQTDRKMDMSSPTGYGAFSMNRATSIQVGNYSTAIGHNTIATSKSQFAFGEYNKASQNKYFVATTDKGSITVPYRSKIYVSMSYTLNDDTGKFVLDNPIEVDISGPHMDIDNYYCTGNNTSSFYLLKSSGTIMDGGKKETYLWGTVYTSKLVTYNRMEYLLCAGNGTSDTERSNAHTLDWNGVGWYQGGLQVGGNAQDDGAKNVLLEGDAIPVPESAEVGQVMRVSEVDENGKPTAWETANLTDDIYVTLSTKYVAGTGFVGTCDTDYQIMYDAIKNNKRVICEDAIGRISQKGEGIEIIQFIIHIAEVVHEYDIYNDNSVIYTLKSLLSSKKIVQETGQAIAVVMSQKATTNALELKADKTDVVAAPTTAEVGQTIVVSEVDETGKPTAWETKDMNSVVTFNTSDYNINMLNAMENSMQGETFTMVDCSVLVHDVSVAVAEKKVPLIFDSNIGAKCFITGVAEDYQIIGSVVGNYSGEFLKADVVIMNEGVHLFVTEIGAEDSTSGGFVVSDTAPTDTSILWVDTSDDSNDGLQEAVNMALAQAKASGEFDGKDGKIPVKGTDYFTSADKAEMVDSVKAALPTLTITGIDSDGVSHTWTMYGVAQ